MPSLKTVALVLATLAGCKSTPTSTPDASPPPIALPPHVPLAEAVCKFRSRDFAPGGEVAVRFSGTAPPFALFPPPAAARDRQSPRMGADLSLPADEDLPFGLLLRGRGIELSGQVDRDVPIHAGVPFALGKFAAALPSTALHVIAASQVEVEVEATAGDSIEIVGEPLKSRGPCSLFGIDQVEFSPTAVIPGVAWRTTPDALLRKGHTIPLTTLPIGDPVARLKPGPNDNHAVAVFETDKPSGRKHIGWLGGPVLVHGWVSATDLAPLPKDRAEPPSVRTGSTSPPEPPFTHPTATCQNEIPIVAQRGDARAVVGAIGNNVPFEILERSGGWAQIRPHIAPLRLTPGSRLVVRESDLATCAGGRL